MTALFRVEVRRLLARRLFRLVTLIVALSFVGAGAIVFFASDLSPEEIHRARADHEAMVQNCIETQGFGHSPEEIDDLERFCRDELAFASADPRFDYARLTNHLTGLAFPFLMLGWIMGASFIGAEWHNRMLTTTLTWEPRRTRVIAAKAAAVAVVVVIWILALQVLYAASMYPAAAVNGITSSVDASLWKEMAGITLRVAGLAAIAAVLGFSLATIGRNTAAALGIGFAYLTVVEGLIRGFKPEWSDWLLGDNIALFLAGNESSPLGHDQTTAGWLLLGYAAVLLMLATAFFRRREMS